MVQKNLSPLAALLIGSTACAHQSSTLAGSWRCDGEPKIADVTGYSTQDFELSPSGSFSVTTTTIGELDGLERVLLAEGAGKWTEADGRLGLAYESAKIKTWMVDGAERELSKRKQFEESMVGTTDGYAIERDQKDAFKMSNDNSEFYCKRVS